MSIRPIDIQTSVTGSRVASDIRQQQQNVEQAHQQNPQGVVEELEKEAMQEVNKSETENKVKEDGDQKKEQQKNSKQKQKDEEEEKKKKKKISDGVRGSRLDFSV
jgi:protein subunit release factor B